MSWANAGSGAAAGASAGSVAGPWGAAIGAVAGGVMGGLTDDPKQPYYAPPPVLPNASYPGGFTDMDQGGYHFDPSTGEYYGTNPWDANSYEDTMAKYRQSSIQSMLWGGGNDVLGEFDWETQRLQQQIDKLKSQKYESKNKNLATQYGLDGWLDEKGELPSMGDILSGKSPALLDKFMAAYKAQGGNYGSTGFQGWLKDVYGKNSNLEQKYQQYKNAMVGDSDSAKAFDDRQKQTMDYYENMLKTRAGMRTQVEGMAKNGPGGILGDTFKTALSGAQGGGDRWGDPYAESWDKDAASWKGKVPDYLARGEAALKDKLPFETTSDSSMFDDLGGVGGGANGRLQAQWDAANSAGAGMERTALPDVPEFDKNLPGQMRMGWDNSVLRSADNAMRVGDRAVARRGLGGSSFGELNRASIGMDTTGRLNDNIVRASQFGEDQKSKRFDQGMSRAGLSVNQESAIADAANRGAQSKFSMMGDFNRLSMDSNKERYGRMNNEYNLKDDMMDAWYKRALAAQGMGNDMNTATWGRKVQGNQGSHGEQMDYLGYIKQMTDDQFDQDMKRRGVYLQGLGTAGSLVGNYNADKSNRDAAAAGMQVQNQQANAAWDQQQSLAKSNQNTAMWQNLGNVAGGLTSYYAGKSKTPTLTSRINGSNPVPKN